MKQERQLLFDGDIRGYRTGKQCLLELYNHKLWKDSVQFTTEEIEIVQNESDGYLDIVDHFIDNAKSLEHEGTTWKLMWDDGSIFAIPKD